MPWDTPEKSDCLALLSALKEAGARVLSRNRIHCPFHNDSRPSSGVYLRPDKTWAFKCLSCQLNLDVYDVRSRVAGRKIAPMKSDPVIQPQEPNYKVYPTLSALVSSLQGVTARYSYTAPGRDEPDLVTLRIDAPDQGKRFVQCSRHKDGWAMKAPPKPWPIYNRSRIAAADRVVVVEGEKCVHALHSIGVVATTSPAGAGRAALADWSPLAGKTVILWPDADPPNEKGERLGVSHMRQIAAILESFGCSVFWIDPYSLSLPPKGDVVDFIAICERGEKGSARQAVEVVIDGAERLGAASEVRSLLSSIASGKWRNVDWPWGSVTRLTRSLIPGSVVVLCGSPGASKSLLLLQAAAHWVQQGIPVAVMEMEEDRRHHIWRALAQASGRVELLDPKWVVANAAEALAIADRHADDMDRLGRYVCAPVEGKDHINDVADWCVAQMKSGKRVVCVDPITAADTGERLWEDERAFIRKIKRAAQEHEASVVLVTHPKKGSVKQSSLDDLAGSAAVQRHTSSVLWLSHGLTDTEREVNVETPFGPQTDECDRLLMVKKARNGPGTGRTVAFEFDSKSLTFREIGVVQR